MKVPITKAVFDHQEMEILAEPLKSGWVVQGPFVRQFEEAFAAYTNSAHAIACTSCTTALHMALVALGIGPGDEVIVPAFTWIATANVVEYAGARPIFCDIDLASFNLDVNQLERRRTKRTRAIIPVHLFGLPVDMRPLLEWANQYNLSIVEDAACGFGARYEGQHVGTFGEFGCFSFHPRKAITTGEGGMILTQDAKPAELCRSLRDHGASKSDLARHQGKAAFLLSEFNQLGFNYRMTDLQGALGVAQMQKAAWIQAQRSSRANRYDQLLQHLDWLRRPAVPAQVTHGYQSYVCLFSPEEPSLENVEHLHDLRNRLMLRLEEIGISTRQGTHAVTTLGYYQNKYGIKDHDYPQALLADHYSITLPLYAQMTDAEQDYVVENLDRVYKELICAAS
jgi:perosamine synthetase